MTATHVQTTRDGNHTGSGKLLRVDDYHVVAQMKEVHVRRVQEMSVGRRPSFVPPTSGVPGPKA
jgi:hypothetical protein